MSVSNMQVSQHGSGQSRWLVPQLYRLKSLLNLSLELYAEDSKDLVEEMNIKESGDKSTEPRDRKTMVKICGAGLSGNLD